MDEKDLVTIGVFDALWRAEAAKVHLESQGIPTFIIDGEIVTMEWAFGRAVGGIKLQVPRADVARAEEVLKAMKDERDRARVPGAAEQCLSCGAAMRADQDRCEKCGWTYVENDAAG